MSGYTAHLDTFAADNLPRDSALPEFLFDLPALRYPDRLNAARELVDCRVEEGMGERPAILAPDEAWTYRELLARANRIARVLSEDMGLVPGNRVLLRSPNSPMTAASWLGVVKAGGIAVATMPLLRARDLAPVIDRARVTHALCDERLADELLRARDAGPGLQRICFFGAGSGELEERMAAKSDDFENVDTSSRDVAAIAFTSGSTGIPKGTIHFQRDILSMCHCVADRLLGMGGDDVCIGTPPLAFTYGLGALLAFPFHCGGATVLLEQATPGELMEAIEHFRATHCFTAPTAYRAMLGEIGNRDLGSLRQCVSAGETLPFATYRAWEREAGIRLVDGIGTTEMTHIFISATGDDIRPGATGRVLPGYRARVVDDELQPLPPGQTGQLAVKGPTGCKYLADERQAEYVQQGWNLTGDAYRVDEEGYFWFQARSDDMIISSGYNISGPEVEAALLDHPAVAGCAVVGSPDPERGRIVKAFVILNPGYPESDDLARQLQEFVKGEIAPHKYPRAVEFVPELPRTETGKIKRFRLREREETQSREGQ